MRVFLLIFGLALPAGAQEEDRKITRSVDQPERMDELVKEGGSPALAASVLMAAGRTEAAKRLARRYGVGPFESPPQVAGHPVVETLFIAAAQVGDAQYLKRTAGDAPSRYRAAAMRAAINRDQPESVATLLAYPASHFSPSDALIHAASTGSPRVLHVLIKRFPDSPLKDALKAVSLTLATNSSRQDQLLDQMKRLRNAQEVHSLQEQLDRYGKSRNGLNQVMELLKKADPALDEGEFRRPRYLRKPQPRPRPPGEKLHKAGK